MSTLTRLAFTLMIAGCSDTSDGDVADDAPLCTADTLTIGSRRFLPLSRFAG